MVTMNKNMNTPKVSFIIEASRIIKGKESKALKPDADGYYCGLPLFVLGETSDNNTKYSIDAAVSVMTDTETMFNKSLVSNGLFGEWGHPYINVKNPDMQRLITIDEKSTSHQFRRIYAAEQTPNGGVIVRGDLKPCGPYKKEHEERLQDPTVDQWYSLRAIATEKMDYRTNTVVRDIKMFITVDAVNRGGFLEASSRFNDNPTIATECFITPQDLINANTGEYVCESIRDKDILNIFGAKELIVGSKSIGLKLPNNKTYMDFDGNKQSSFHAILGYRRQ